MDDWTFYLAVAALVFGFAIIGAEILKQRKIVRDFKRRRP